MIKNIQAIPYIKAYNIPTTELALATTLMNYNSTSPKFVSRVVDVVFRDDFCVVVVCLEGTYPFIISGWEDKLTFLELKK